MNEYALLVVGGGPAGLFCALRAAVPGRSVLILEKKQACGRKLLITGSGQCNLTHDGDIRSFLSHYGDNGKFLKPALMTLKNSDLISFFSDRGLELSTETGGKVFPTSRKATDILSILLRESEARGVTIRSNEPVVSIQRSGDGFLVSTNQGQYSADNVVIATGGMTYPATGSSGDGYRFAQDLGHHIISVRPALAAIIVHDFQFSSLSGISLPDTRISLFRDGRKIREHRGDILFTHTGLSGPGILDFSRFIHPGDVLTVALISGEDPQSLSQKLITHLSSSGNRLVRTVLAEFNLPDRLIRTLLDVIGISRDLTGSHLSRQDRVRLVNALLQCPFTVGKTGGAEEAMVTCGGVSLSEINPKTMESKLVPGLFFIGEVLDIDGDTGGYNLQAAFSTAALAAECFGKKGNSQSGCL